MNPSHARSRIDALHQRVSQINEAAAQLAKERAELFEELNSLEPPIRVLPPEILHLIFYFARPSGFSKAWQTALFCNLTLVSKHWRRVLLSNPALWTKVDLRLSKDPRRDANPLLTYITHSGQHPLSLDLVYWADFDANNTTLIHPSVDPSLLENFGRIKRLHLHFSPLGWFHHRTLLQQLTHLSLHGVDTSDDLLLSLDQAVSLTLHSSPRIRVASSPLITTLDLISMPISSSFYIFINCPNLQKLYLTCNFKDKNPGFPVDSFILPHLKVLRWTIFIYEDDRWYKAILDHIRFPSLQELEWREEGSMKYDIVGQHITSFFCRLPTTLTSLKLHCVMDCSNNDIRYLPPMACQLETIEFITCRIDHFKFLLQKLESAGQFPRLHTIKADRLVFPVNIPSPFTKDREFYHWLEENFTNSCLTILRNRMNDTNRRFTLEMEQDELEWLYKIEEGLQGFRPGGHQVKVVRTGCKMVVSM